MSPPTDSDGDGQQEQSEPEARESADERYQREIIRALDAIAKEQQRANNQSDANKPKHRFLEWFTAFGIWAAAIVGIVAVRYGIIDAHKQRGVMKEQSAFLDRQAGAILAQTDILNAAQRPWIEVQRSEITSPLVIDEKGASVTIIAFTKNVGKSPAKFVLGGAALYSRTFENIRSDVPDKVCAELRERKIESHGAGHTLFPDQEGRAILQVYMSAADWEVTRELIAKLAGTAMISGCIDYLIEGSPKHHQTHFVYEFDKAGPNGTFLPLDTVAGSYAPDTLRLAINPMVGTDAD